MAFTRQTTAPDKVAPAFGETMEILGAAVATPARTSAAAEVQMKMTRVPGRTFGLGPPGGRELFETAQSA